ncbi:MAG: ribosome biogenesis factor YjgA [Gammaproteobacteria bacterium]
MRLTRQRSISEPETDSNSESISKTRKKRQSAELQQLGSDLSRLTAAQLDCLDLDAELRSALDLARKIKPGGALKRQIKFIGGLLRQRESDPIRDRLAELKHQSGAVARQHHVLESWRERLLAEGDAALEALLEEFPGIDRQQIRQMVRSARNEAEKGQPPLASRTLYRYLRSFIQ